LSPVNTSTSPDSETSRWVDGVDDLLHKRLSAAGLVTPRVIAGPVKSRTIAAVFDKLIATKKKPATIAALTNAKKKLVAFLGTKPVGEIVKRDVEQWRESLVKESLAENTVRRLIGYGHQAAALALSEKWMTVNPFADFEQRCVESRDRQEFIAQETIAKVIDAAPDAEWRLLIALARYAGLRTPSEPFNLKWQMIDWSDEDGSIEIVAPKTQHHDDGGIRRIPLYAEVRPHLMKVFEQAGDGATFVFSEKFRSQRAPKLSLRFERIIRKAGLCPWKKLWNNLRSSRQSELERKHGNFTASKLMGNSTMIAFRHYNQIDREVFRQEAGKQQAGDSPAKTQSLRHDQTRSDPTTETDEGGNGAELAGVSGSGRVMACAETSSFEFPPSPLTPSPSLPLAFEAPSLARQNIVC
jgi:integrase